MQLQPVFAMLALAISAQASTVADVMSDIAALSNDVTALSTGINTFSNSGGSMAAALAIHNDAASFITTVTKATTDINNLSPLPLSEADGAMIFNAVNDFKPTILSALAEIATKRTAFTALPVSGMPALVKSDLDSMDTARTAFENALIATAPSPALMVSAASLQSSCSAQFATAIAAFADA